MNEQLLFDMVSEQRRLVHDAIHKTKAARKSAQRVAYALDAGFPPARQSLPPPQTTLPESDDTDPIVPFQIEERL